MLIEPLITMGNAPAGFTPFHVTIIRNKSAQNPQRLLKKYSGIRLWASKWNIAFYSTDVAVVAN